MISYKCHYNKDWLKFVKEQGMPECAYPYIIAWEQMMQGTKRRIEEQLTLAQRENAPQDAMWRSINGKWHLFSEMADHNHNKALIAAYVKGIEDDI